MLKLVKVSYKFMNKAINILKKEGRHSLESKIGNFIQKQDVISFYNYILETSYDEELEEFNLPIREDKLIINWVVPEMGVGSGGHINIFRIINFLEKKGHQNRVYVFNSNRFLNRESLRKYLEDFYNISPESTTEFYHTAQDMDYSHATIATSWHTAYCVKSFNKTKKKFYFVQDYEPYFYPKGSEYIFAENTYKFGFHGITAGTWLADKLSKEYGMRCDAFGFSYDKELYKPMEKREENIKHVLFYARPVTPRRVFEIGLMALNELYKKMPEVGIIFAGWDVSNYEIPFPHLNAGSVSLEELPDLYSQCDIALVLSGTNLSLLPLEIMACNCAVMSNKGEHVEWLLNEDNSILVDNNPKEIAEEMEKYLKNDEMRKSLIKKSFDFAQNTSWEKEAEKVEYTILREVKNETC